jgi:hypothetical protein
VTVPAIAEFFDSLVARSTGPLKFRLVLQPVMAAFFAIRSGIRDGRQGRRPFLETIVLERASRRGRIAEGWRDVGRILLLAVGMDLVYQALVIHAFRPLEAAVISVAVAIVPYLILRGVVSRLVARLRAI